MKNPLNRWLTLSLAAPLLALAALYLPANTMAQESVRLDTGLVKDAAPDASGIRSFKGIPYAGAPVGDLRWKPPVPAKPWDGVRNADTWGPRCVQSERLGPIDPLNPRMDEDCLYLNVWAPAKAASGPLPVMVWIYGGSNTNGAASQPEYDGAQLARNGVIVVSLNYRLDIFGFLAHPDLTAESGTKSSGNYGLLDQLAALQWVQKNIAAFGGDPKKVTVFGESAGAFNISLLMASPLAKGLFSGAIGQSGGALSRIPGLGPLPLSAGEVAGARFAQSVGANTITELRAKPASELLAAILKSPILYGLGVVDGYVVPEHPAIVFGKGAHNDVPLLTGANADEGSLFAARMKVPPNEQAFGDLMRAQFKGAADKALAVYPPGATAESAKAAFVNLIGDQLINYGNWSWAENAASKGKSPVYRYYFNRRPPSAPELSIYPLAAPGVFHAAEITYVFNNYEYPRGWTWQDTDRALGKTMSSYWTIFAKTGNPNGAGLPAWEAYRPGGGGKVMELGASVMMRDETNRSRFEFFEALLGPAVK
jgi:para-nitrobenzyl esterase